MNTSNKILAGFFLLVFLVPAMMVMAFKSKIRKDEYKMVSRDWYHNGNWKTGKLESAKIVKLVGIPGNVLKVNLSYADTASYNYHKGQLDSIRIQSLGDTIIIQYRFAGSNANEISDAGLYLDLSLPDFEQLVAENVEVNLVSWDSSGTKNMVVDLKGTSRFTMGMPAEDEFSRVRGRKPITLNRFSAKIENASLYLGKEVILQEMNVDASGKAILDMNKEVVVGRMTGSLSDNSSVNADWRYLKQLHSVPAQ